MCAVGLPADILRTQIDLRDRTCCRCERSLRGGDGVRRHLAVRSLPPSLDDDDNRPLTFSYIYSAEAKRVLHAQSRSDESEKEYLLEYYSLVREGKTNYISTMAFHMVTGNRPMEPPDFFKTYSESFLPEHTNKKRKTENGK